MDPSFFVRRFNVDGVVGQAVVAVARGHRADSMAPMVRLRLRTGTMNEDFLAARSSRGEALPRSISFNWSSAGQTIVVLRFSL